MSFLGLPPELKDRIFDFYIPTTTTPQAHLIHRQSTATSVSPARSFWRFTLTDPLSARELRLSLRRVCHQLRSDLHRFLASRSTLHIDAVPCETYLTPLSLSVVPAEFLRRVLRVQCDQLLSADVLRFFPGAKVLILRCGVVRTLGGILGTSTTGLSMGMGVGMNTGRWTKASLEAEHVRGFVTEDLSEMFAEERANVRRVSGGREVEVQLARYYGRFKYGRYESKVVGMVLDATAREGKGGCEVEIKFTREFELHLLTASSVSMVVE